MTSHLDVNQMLVLKISTVFQPLLRSVNVSLLCCAIKPLRFLSATVSKWPKAGVNRRSYVSSRYGVLDGKLR